MPDPLRHPPPARRFLSVSALALTLLAVLAGPAIAQDTGSDAPGNPAAGDPPEKLRFGVLFWHDSPNDEAAFKGIRDALVETRVPHEFIVRQADSDAVKAARALEEFKSAPVDLVFAMGTWAARHAADHITDTPIVFTAVTNPVESGVVPSWKGSGRNLAGNSNWIPPESLLHVFRLTVPELTRLGILRSTVSGEVSDAELRDMRDHLAQEGAPQVTIVEQVVERAADIPDAADRLAAANVEAVWIPIDFLVYSNLDAILPAVEPHRIPLVSSSLKAARAGAVSGVVVDYELLGKRALVIARDILDGKADPATMPIETMNAYKVVVNLDAARRCHYEVPLSLLVRADMILDETARSEEAAKKESANQRPEDGENQREQDNE